MNLVKINDDTSLTLPLFLKHVPAGFPSPAADYIEERINLDPTPGKYLFTQG